MLSAAETGQADGRGQWPVSLVTEKKTNTPLQNILKTLAKRYLSLQERDPFFLLVRSFSLNKVVGIFLDRQPGVSEFPVRFGAGSIRMNMLQQS
jgi:hypothetical protein